jgi:hypothetical protein
MDETKMKEFGHFLFVDETKMKELWEGNNNNKKYKLYFKILFNNLNCCYTTRLGVIIFSSVFT